jgi:hypothetical protein
MPGEIAPMLCTLTKEPIDDRDYLYEIKWDGTERLCRYACTYQSPGFPNVTKGGTVILVR